MTPPDNPRDAALTLISLLVGHWWPWGLAVVVVVGGLVVSQLVWWWWCRRWLGRRVRYVLLPAAWFDVSVSEVERWVSVLLARSSSRRVPRVARGVVWRVVSNGDGRARFEVEVSPAVEEMVRKPSWRGVQSRKVER